MRVYITNPSLTTSSSLQPLRLHKQQNGTTIRHTHCNGASIDGQRRRTARINTRNLLPPARVRPLTAAKRDRIRLRPRAIGTAQRLDGDAFRAAQPRNLHVLGPTARVIAALVLVEIDDGDARDVAAVIRAVRNDVRIRIRERELRDAGPAVGADELGGEEDAVEGAERLGGDAGGVDGQPEVEAGVHDLLPVDP